MEETKDIIQLHWCKEHKNWWVIDCPYCMLDDNEESIKQEGRIEVIKWLEVHKAKGVPITEGNLDARTSEPCLIIKLSEWQGELKKWGIQGAPIP